MGAFPWQPFPGPSVATAGKGSGNRILATMSWRSQVSDTPLLPGWLVHRPGMGKVM